MVGIIVEIPQATRAHSLDKNVLKNDFSNFGKCSNFSA
jgi:hypothetical protein